MAASRGGPGSPFPCSFLCPKQRSGALAVTAASGLAVARRAGILVAGRIVNTRQKKRYKGGLGRGKVGRKST
jgi:hypothetical protein